MEIVPCQILTAEALDVRARLVLRFLCIAQDGVPLEALVEGERAVFFVHRGQALPAGAAPVARRTLALRSLADDEVDAVYFDSLRAYRKAVALCDEALVRTYETDIAPAERYLMERFIHGQAEVQGEPDQSASHRLLKRSILRPCTLQPPLTCLSLDIETGVHEEKLYSIALHCTGSRGEVSRVLLNDSTGAQEGAWSSSVPGARRDAPAEAGVPPDADELAPFELVRVSDECALLKAFLAELALLDPDLIIGWHVVGFDLDYLQRACTRNGLPFRVGRIGRNGRIVRNAGGRWFAEIPGRVVFDGPSLLRGAFYQFEDFRLETVAQELLGRGKLIHTDDDAKVAEIERLYQEDREALARYNLEDARLVSAIFEKTGLIQMQLKRTQISGLLLDQIGRSTAAFDHLFLPRLHRRGFVAPNVRDIQPQGHAAGGYVMDPVVGLYEHVVVLDFKSLYPSIIRTFHIDPLSRLHAALRPEEPLLRTPSGQAFSRTEHILPEVIRGLLEQRAAAKSAGDAHLSQAIKILMNSLYGVMGSFGCRFYHPSLPSAITSTGQWLLKGCREFLEAAGYPVLYGDTDSVFVHLKAAEGAQADTIGKHLANELNEYWAERLSREFQVTSCLEMQYEKHYHRFLLPPLRGAQEGAKKRYAGLRRVEGREQLDFVGMEFVRSDWSPLAREFQYQLYWRMFHQEEIRDWIREEVSAIRRGQRNKLLVYRKRLRKDERHYTRNVPPQVRAARMLGGSVREVRYLMTPEGPVPIQLRPEHIDYDHYIDKQIAPIADAVLPLLGMRFSALVRAQQLELFSSSSQD